MRTAVVLCVVAASGCDGVFGLDSVPTTSDAAAPGGLAFIQQVQAQAMEPALSLLVPFTRPPTAHDLLVVAIGAYHNVPTVISDTAGNTYQQVPAQIATDGGSSLYLYYASDIAKASPFTITVASMENQVNQDELSVVAIEYSGADAVAPLDQMKTNKGTGSTSQVDQDCLPLQVASPEIMVAATTRDFNGNTDVAPGWIARGSVDLDHTKYAVISTADRIAGPEVAHPVFSSAHGGDGYTWGCVWATFR